MIPTRNRSELATLAVRCALEQSGDDCEVVVADNGDEALTLADHPRLRHLPPPPQPLSMPDNWERALAAASGEWLMLLSDKYMLVPGWTGRLLALAESEGAQAVTYGYAVLRQGLPRGATDPTELARAGGRLALAPLAPVVCEPSRDLLRRVYFQAGRYAAFAPMLYTALVHRRVVQFASARTERFFFGPCPDIASGLQVLSNSDAVLRTNWPAVMVQYPSDDPEWSTGLSTLTGGRVGGRFFTELGERRASSADRLIASLIFDTLRTHAARLEPGLLDQQAWHSYAWEASREVEGLPLGSRYRTHLAMLRRTQGDGLRPRAAWIQLRAAVGYHTPRVVAQPLLRLLGRREGNTPDAVPKQVDVPSRDAALSRCAG